MSASFIRCWPKLSFGFSHDSYDNTVYIAAPLDEKVAALHLEKVGATLTTLRDDQADYIALVREARSKQNSTDTDQNKAKTVL